MKKKEDIQEILIRMAELLRVGEINDWAAALDSLASEVSVEPDKAFAKILGMYGGMGSLNDLVLYRKGRLLSEENDELDKLRMKLHVICQD